LAMAITDLVGVAGWTCAVVGFLVLASAIVGCVVLTCVDVGCTVFNLDAAVGCDLEVGILPCTVVGFMVEYGGMLGFEVVGFRVEYGGILGFEVSRCGFVGFRDVVGREVENSNVGITAGVGSNGSVDSNGAVGVKAVVGS
jgi:hypothetical protein